MITKTEAKLDAALSRYLAARRTRGEGDGSFEEFKEWALKQDLSNDDDFSELLGVLCDQVWVETTREALGLVPDGDDDHKRITIDVEGKSINLPRYIVTPGETDDFGDSIHFAPPHATVRHHRIHADWMMRVGSIEAGREQLTLNAELLRRAGGDQDAIIGKLLAA
jgi:hypothetical protein